MSVNISTNTHTLQAPAGKVKALFQGAVGETADFIDCRNSSNTLLFKVDSNGSITSTAGNITSTIGVITGAGLHSTGAATVDGLLTVNGGASITHGPFSAIDGNGAQISTDGSGNVVIDSTGSLTIGPSAPNVMSVVGVNTTVSGGDSLSFPCAGALSFFGAAGAAQAAAPNTGDTLANRITAIENALVAYGLMA